MLSHDRKQYAHRCLDELLSRCAQANENSQAAYWRLIHAVRARSQLLQPQSNPIRHHPDAIKRIVNACAGMAKVSHLWYRQPEDWIVIGTGPFEQFRSLVSHLFDHFPVPKFMAQVWTCEDRELWNVDLYLHLASGCGIRQFDGFTSFRVSKRTAGFFMQAPDHLSPMNALRWAQIRAQGGDDRLARVLLSSTTLMEITRDEEFWESVISFLAENQPISVDEILEILIFIEEQRFQPAERLGVPAVGNHAVQPDFSLRGRTLMSLRRHMANWRAELGIKGPVIAPYNPQWATTDIRPCNYADGESIWMINEISCRKDLLIEARIMRHCVASYLQCCIRGQTSIWTMQLQQGKRNRRVLTVEVIPQTRTIRQARGWRNSRPTPCELEVLEHWSEQESLKFAKTL